MYVFDSIKIKEDINSGEKPYRSDSIDAHIEKEQHEIMYVSCRNNSCPADFHSKTHI